MTLKKVVWLTLQRDEPKTPLALPSVFGYFPLWLKPTGRKHERVYRVRYRLRALPWSIVVVPGER